MNILLVEDNDLVSELVQASLEGRQHRLTVTARPADAQRHIDGAAEPIDLLIVDFNLGGGPVTGSDLAARFHARFPASGVLMITGSPELARRSLPDAKNIRLLSKPFRVAELMLALDRLEPQRFASGRP